MKKLGGTRRGQPERSDPGSRRDWLAEGNALLLQGQLQAAEALYLQGLRVSPEHSRLLFALADCLYRQGKWPEAISRLEALLALEPDWVQAWLNLGAAYAQLCDPEQVYRCLQQAVRLEPGDAGRFSHLLVQSWARMLEFGQRFALFREWDRLHARPLTPANPVYANLRDPGRRLRLGYVSGDFYNVSATLLFLPLFQHADRASFELVAYSNHSRRDQVTELIRAGCDEFVQVEGLDDKALAERIRADRIDLLVDLAGHTQHHRLGAFARRPAPLQFTGLGFISTTGLDAIQYRFTDTWVSPPEQQGYNSETCLYLPSIMYWQPLLDPAAYYSPEPPSARGGFSFGCLNAPYKLESRMLALWAAILQAVPGARLCFKSPGFENPALQQRYRSLFARAGVAPERLVFVGKTSLQEHLRFHGQIDLALDPFPYQGGITTCESLAMGVPVLSLAGGTGTSLSVLGTLGLGSLIALDPQDYLHKAVALSQRPAQLKAWRRELPGRLRSSPVCDPQRRVAAIEAHYRACWQRWCAGP